MSSKRYEYKYPDNLDLSPSSSLHSKLINEIKRLSEYAYSKGSSAREKAKNIDTVLYNFVTEKEHEDILKFKKSGNIPAPLNIIIPVSKAVLDTWTTYMANAFLSNPYGIYNVRGLGNEESNKKALLQEILLNTQAIWFGHDSKLITFWKDCYAYGLGSIMPVWDKHRYKVPTWTYVTEELLPMLRKNMKVNIGDFIRYIQEVTLHEGNNLINIDFYSVFIDPNTSINDSDKFEYAGFFERANILDYLRKEPDPEENLFNCKYAKDIVDKSSGGNTVKYGRDRDYSSSDIMNKSNFCDITHFFWKLIPKEWGLGESEYPEVYYFRVVNNSVIISCVNLEYITGSLPIVFGAPNTDGYDTYPLSYIATTFGIQKYVDWKARSQVANQTKVLNDMIIIDPYVFEMDDILNPEPGKIIRTKRSMYGTGNIDNYIKQLSVVDMTQNNMNDISNIINLMYQILGTTDIIMGDLSRLPERPTAQGIMIARNSAMSRLQKDAQILVSQMWYKLLFQMACNNVMLMSKEVAINIGGTRYQKILEEQYNYSSEMIVIQPSDLTMEFDIVPVNKFQQETNIQAMSIFLERALQFPEVMSSILSSFNIPAIFRAYMRKIGFENIDDYVVNMPTQNMNATIMNDEDVMNELQKGNIIPVQQQG